MSVSTRASIRWFVGVGLLILSAGGGGCAADKTDSGTAVDVETSALRGGAGHHGSCRSRDDEDTTCNGVDDDCDGILDEDCDFGPAQCPAGYNIIVGTNRNDILIGTHGRDCILGYGGNDRLYGLSGDDLLVGGPGDDRLFGGFGDDILNGGPGDDKIEGEAGDDILDGGDGNDTLDGGRGDDTIHGGRCHDSIEGGSGKDKLFGDEGSDRIECTDRWSTSDGGADTDACDGANCELSCHSHSCRHNWDCWGGKVCLRAGSVGICVPAAEVKTEDATCDGIDDDCDGEIDEDYLEVTTTCGTDSCGATGKTSCEHGHVKDSCVVPESCDCAADDVTCDGVDDDCDGNTDEDYASTSTTCGTGACASTGAQSCVAGAVVDSCQAGTPSASDTTCDGVDDDCNGSVDDGYVSTPTSCGIGDCLRAGSTSCAGGAIVDSCVPGAPAANDASCDGQDNNCNGLIDEDFSDPTVTTCGVGACASTGSNICMNGSIVNSCTPGTPAPVDAQCNGIDDNCNGQVDEVACDNNDPCDGVESCNANVCQPGVPPVIDDGNPCTADSCDSMGVHHAPVTTDTVSCSNGLACDGAEFCLQAPNCVPPPANIYAWWPGDDDATDIVGDLDGTLLNGTTFAAGRVGQAFSFDGVDDTVDLSAHADAINLGGEATLEMWVLVPTDTCRTLFHLKKDDDNEQYLQVGANCTSEFSNELVTWTYIRDGQKTVEAYTTTVRSQLISTTTTHYLALTFNNGGGTEIYLDGTVHFPSSNFGPNEGTWGGFDLPIESVTMGGNTSIAGDFFEGRMDEVTLYSTALSSGQLLPIRNAGQAGKCKPRSCRVAPNSVPSPGTACEGGGTCNNMQMCIAP